MRLRNIPGARETIADSKWIVQDPGAHKGKWKELFGNDAVIIRVAVHHADRISSVLIRALDKLDESQIQNLLFIRGDAELICEYFDEGEVERIYLNFSDPWPKDRHAKRRLPSKEFLRRFAQILTPDGTIEFKTDNRALFDFAVEEVEAGGFKILQITYDLHNDPVMNEGNIMTEYEERFSAKGNPICKYILGR